MTCEDTECYNVGDISLRKRHVVAGVRMHVSVSVSVCIHIRVYVYVCVHVCMCVYRHTNIHLDIDCVLARTRRNG
jgi:hypothetical protein